MMALEGAGGANGLPRLISGEVGNVDATTVVVTFSRGVLASDYAAGITIEADGIGATIDSATRQANTAIIHFALHAAVTADQEITISYDDGVGDYSDLAASQLLASFTDRPITNNLSGGVALDFSQAVNSMYLTLGV